MELFLTEYDAQHHMEQEREENYEAGREDGIREGITRGKAEGRVEGKVEGKAEAICLLLEEFGSLPASLRARVVSQEDTAVLDRWLRAAGRARSLADFLDRTGLKEKEESEHTGGTV